MDALENAGRQPAQVYRESVLYTTLSPCAMCSGAILLYGIPTVIVGENQTFLGEEELLRSRGVSVTVLQDPACIAMMADFIREHPESVERGHRSVGSRKTCTTSSTAVSELPDKSMECLHVVVDVVHQPCLAVIRPLLPERDEIVKLRPSRPCALSCRTYAALMP